MRVNVLHSPFRHWVRGLLWEIAAFGGFMIVAGLLVAAILYIL
ncbi:MAG: hypothetical protein OEV43_08120 [Coriobacteriia bacterium]|nr:hypothetical protein [Coriobacteriia bacterium]